ncbi:MAG: hypothetical protein LBI43_06475 [Streptococcaceae bacterium]|jgi:tetratricopeptide (TPR) repeat protein|nr:hypothetical protein [Streptococcaceae bacterium]
MQVLKNNENSIWVIKSTARILNAENLLNNFELKFLEFEFNDKELSLTANQEVDHQLRFFHNEYAFELINSVVIKLIENNAFFEDIKIIGSNISEYEQFFLKRIAQLSPYSYWITNGTGIILEKEEVSYANFRHFQEIGNNYSAKQIGLRLFTSEKFHNDANFLKLLSFVFSETGDPFAAVPLLRKVIKTKSLDEITNNARTSAMYRLAMLLMRELPESFQNKAEATELLDHAYKKITSKEYKFPEETRLFAKIFNRNGLALALFQDNKYNDAINLIKGLIDEIRPLAENNGFAKLHFTVLHYNLYQLYHAINEIEESEKIIKKVIALDPKDMDYKYDYILFLFENNRFDDARSLLIQMYQSGIFDFVFNNSYMGYYYIKTGDLVTAEEYCRKAYIYFAEEGYKDRNKFLYNYLFCLKNNNKIMEMEKLKNRIIDNEFLSTEIQGLYE